MDEKSFVVERQQLVEHMRQIRQKALMEAAEPESPGFAFLYSPTGHWLLGQVKERVSRGLIKGAAAATMGWLVAKVLPRRSATKSHARSIVSQVLDSI